MKILVCSDSHGNSSTLNDVMNRIHKDIAVAIHLGDGYSDLMVAKQQFQSLSYYCVKGNCDSGTDAEQELFLTIGGKKFLLSHGHRYNVKYSLDRLCYRAMEKEAEVCLFGHTHTPTVFYEKATLFMNPGSISYSRNIGYPSYGIVDISDCGLVTPSIVGKVVGDSYKVINIRTSWY